MDTYEDLARYLDKVLGRPPRIKPLSEERLSALPLFLRSSYRFVVSRIYDVDFVFALTDGNESEKTPTEYAKHVDTLERILGQQVALVFPEITAYKRNRLVHQRIPFVVPERQLFLPTLFVDLRERFPRSTKRTKHLSASSQTLLLYYLLGKQVRGVPLQDLARELGYSAMTLSNVSRQLDSIGFSKTERQGKSLSIAFAHSRKELWEIALDRMSSPVKKRHWASWQTPLGIALKAGTTALAELTLLSDDRLPTYAMHDPAWAKAIRTKRAIELPGQEDATACIEEWKYDPLVLSRGPLVDSLSLYLSLRNSSDERVQTALDQTIEGMTW